MKVLLAVIVFSVGALATSLANEKQKAGAEVVQQWEDFKAQYDRNYANEAEELMRFKIFVENLQMVNDHNAKFERGETTYTMGINQFSDMTEEENSQMHGFGGR